MDLKKQTIDELTEDFLLYLEASKGQRVLSGDTLPTWERLKAYMALHKHKIYTPKIGEAFLVSELGTYRYEELPLSKQNYVSKIEALVDFQNTGKVLLGMRKKTRQRSLMALSVRQCRSL